MVLAGRYERVYGVYKTTKSYQTNSITNKNKHNHKHKHNHSKPIFFLDPVRSHQIRQDLTRSGNHNTRITRSGEISLDPATTVEENNEIR